jgi:hypothetical protein
VHAHEVNEPGPSSGFPLRGPDSDASDLRIPTNDDRFLDQGNGDERGRVWLEMADETYGYQYDWKLGEYEIEHEDDGSDRFDDEYEHDDLLDQA